MLSAAREFSDMLKGLTLEEFQAERVVMRATERCIEIIGEAARRVSTTPRQLQTEIPWSDLVGQRNILAHGACQPRDGIRVNNKATRFMEFAEGGIDTCATHGGSRRFKKSKSP